MFYTAICALARDEDKDIIEWINYHLAIGFEHIVIYDNNSRNPLKHSLREYVENKLVTVHDLRLTDAQQLSAYHHALNEWRDKTFWLAFIDIDEFFVPHAKTDIRDFLDGYREYGGLGVHWKMFSSNGHIGRPQGYVIENYDKFININPHIKSVVRCSATSAPKSPHHFIYKDGFYCVNEDFFPINNFYSYPVANKISLNHYYYKSQQDFEDKMARGFVTRMKSAETRTIDTFYSHIDLPAATDKGIKRFLPLLGLFAKLPIPAIAAKVGENRINNYVAGIEAISQKISKNDLAGAKTILKYLRRYHDKFEIRLVEIMLKFVEGNQVEAIKMLGREFARTDVGKEEQLVCLRELANIYSRAGLADAASSVEIFARNL